VACNPGLQEAWHVRCIAGFGRTFPPGRPLSSSEEYEPPCEKPGSPRRRIPLYGIGRVARPEKAWPLSCPKFDARGVPHPQIARNPRFGAPLTCTIHLYTMEHRDSGSLVSRESSTPMCPAGHKTRGGFPGDERHGRTGGERKTGRAPGCWKCALRAWRSSQAKPQ
jgi:hypothetical protein